MSDAFKALERDIVACSMCPRLRDYCERIAREKRRAYRDQDYWGKPVPGFGDPAARLHVIGLAPGAHGANRTGRVFTGDRSGDWLFRALHQTGFASQAASLHKGDGLMLMDAWISASVRCAPPGNKPSPDEIRTCRQHSVRESSLLSKVQVVVVLGRLAFASYLSILLETGMIRTRKGLEFSHGREHSPAPGLPRLICSYHPSQQNTQTGRLTEEMLRSVFERARTIIRS